MTFIMRRTFAFLYLSVNSYPQATEPNCRSAWHGTNTTYLLGSARGQLTILLRDPLAPIAACITPVQREIKAHGLRGECGLKGETQRN